MLLEYIHISCANTFGMGELTAAIVEIPHILPKTHQLQIIMICGGEKNRTINDHLPLPLPYQGFAVLTEEIRSAPV